MPKGLPRAELKELVLEKIELFSEMMIPDAVMDRRGTLRGRSVTGDIWVIETQGSKRGACFDTSGTLERADIFAFMVAGPGRGSVPETERIILDALGIRNGVSTVERQRLKDQAAARAAKVIADVADNKSQRDGLRFYAEAAESDDVCNYLAGRGITGPRPEFLRIGMVYSRPAMIGPVCQFGPDPPLTGNYTNLRHGLIQVAAHTTKLVCDGQGRLSRLKEKNAKMTWGPPMGHFLPLRRGQLGWANLHRAERRAPALIGEGIENVASMEPAYRGVCSLTYLSSAFLAGFELPRCFDRVLLVVDRDGDNRGIRAGRETMLRRLIVDEGRGVELIAPPPEFKDANDWLRALIARGYRPDFSSAPLLLDWRTVLRESVPVTAGDPAACFWENVTGGRWGDRTEPTALLLHPTLPLIECSGITMPALIMPIFGKDSVPIGAIVAWLAQHGDSRWDLAPLLLPIRLIGEGDGVAVIGRGRPVRQDAALVIGVENALTYGRIAAKQRMVLCVADACHLVWCAAGVPSNIRAVEVYADRWDPSLGNEALLKIGKDRLRSTGAMVSSVRPWEGYASLHGWIRDPEIARLLGIT